ncbi:MAG: mechanosensitive ion channel, partial [Alphaproteobacteria bacterium]|nr:mechanosensitive ion channel [Alphaproteobacteria bacterium]
MPAATPLGRSQKIRYLGRGRVQQRDLGAATGEPEPFVLFQDFGASSLDFELRCFTGNVMDRRAIASDIRFEIDRRFRD